MTTPPVLGGDVANYQGRIDWARVAAAGWRYAWVLATDGSTFFDTFEPDDVAGSRANGLATGGYHFARPAKHNADVEGAWYRAHVGDELELPTALDMEADWLPGVSANTDWALRFFDRIAAPVRVLYTNGDGATRHLDSTRLVAAGVELWYAHPGATTFAGVAAWPRAAAVQYGTGPVDGITGLVDLDAMDPDVFARWTTGDEPMRDPHVLQLADTGELVVFPADGARPWLCPAADQAMVAVFVFRVFDPVHPPMPDPVPQITDPAQITAVRHWVITGTPPAGGASSLVGQVQIALHPA